MHWMFHTYLTSMADGRETPSAVTSYHVLCSVRGSQGEARQRGKYVHAFRNKALPSVTVKVQNLVSTKSHVDADNQNISSNKLNDAVLIFRML